MHSAGRRARLRALYGPRHLSPLRLRRLSTFEVYCEETGVLPEHVNRNGFYLPLLEGETLRRDEPLCLDEDRTLFWDHLRARGGQAITMKTPPVFLAGLYNASLLNDGSTIRSCDNILLCDPSHHPRIINSDLNHHRPPVVVPRVELKLNGEYVHFGSLWGLGYYH
jgi:hypothetical protein